MKIKISEATNIQLDWLVAKCEGYVEEGVYGEPKIIDGCVHLHYCDVVLSSDFKPTTDWSDGGPIIERECIQTLAYGAASEHPKNPEYWEAVLDMKTESAVGYGPTPLIAAMRCFCTSKLGDEAEIPEELT